MKKTLHKPTTYARPIGASKVSAKYQVVIPKATRAKLDIKPGDVVSVWLNEKGEAVITKQSKSIVAMLDGLGSDVWESLGDAEEYLEKERNSWDD